MYHFNIVQQDNGEFRFELDGINLIVDGYELKEEKHWLRNPENAIAFFNIKGHLYGVSNKLKTSLTAEAFFDLMKNQYEIFLSSDKKKEKMNGVALSNGKQAPGVS